jgi:UDP-N-acetylmuramyl tripeptide synthase
VPGDCAAAAVAAAVALGLSADVIDTGIDTYDGNGGNVSGARARLEHVAAG